MAKLSGLRILLTGGTGFLGRNLTRQLLVWGADVVLLGRIESDFTRLGETLSQVRFYRREEQELDAIFAREKPEMILHCATNYGRGQMSPTSIIEANLSLPLHLLQCAQKFGTPIFINTDTILDKRVSHYTLSKKQFLDWLRLFSRDVACINVALEHFYGPGDDPSKFVMDIIGRLLENRPAIDLTEGEQKRDFIFIDDVVAAFGFILEDAVQRTRWFVPHEVGSGQSVSIRQFVSLAQQTCGNTGTDLRFGALPYRDNEVMETCLDLGSLKSLGWQPRVSLAEGLERTVAAERKRRAL